MVSFHPANPYGSSTIATTTQQPPRQPKPAILRLRSHDPHEKTWPNLANLLQTLQSSSLLNEKEKEALNFGPDQLTAENLPQTLAHLILNSVRASLIRHIEYGQSPSDLLEWERELIQLLQDALPSNIDAEQFIEAIDELISRNFSEKASAIEEEFAAAEDALYEEADALNLEIWEKGQKTRKAIRELQEKRQAELNRMTNTMTALSSQEEQTHARLDALHVRAQQEAERTKAIQEREGAVINHALSILKRD